MIYISRSPTNTNKFAQQIASGLKPGSVLALYGDLGAGKTTFTQFLAHALGVAKTPTSPTFVIMRSYPLPNTKEQLHHLDLYRINSAADIKALDVEELIKEGNHILVIEWPEKIEHLLPPHTIKINFETLTETKRSISILKS